MGPLWCPTSYLLSARFSLQSLLCKPVLCGITSWYPILVAQHFFCFLPRDSYESYKISQHSHRGILEVWGSHSIGWPSASGRQVPMNKCSPLSSKEWLEGAVSTASQRIPQDRAWLPIVMTNPHTHFCVGFPSFHSFLSLPPPHSGFLGSL